MMFAYMRVEEDLVGILSGIVNRVCQNVLNYYYCYCIQYDLLTLCCEDEDDDADRGMEKILDATSFLSLSDPLCNFCHFTFHTSDDLDNAATFEHVNDPNVTTTDVTIDSVTGCDDTTTSLTIDLIDYPVIEPESTTNNDLGRELFPGGWEEFENYYNNMSLYGNNWK
ncbi:6718_t:CDS:1 [Acaulospora colombiana]|uniref:6718_t:CDS:1 n=1 Tax=Acaulospora colombiana TaxID=27376 RepID=A0ACA9K4A6_9GLOM|nr:6718_t:CDS:1 [Acaulospora colombiana]